MCVVGVEGEGGSFPSFECECECARQTKPNQGKRDHQRLRQRRFLAKTDICRLPPLTHIRSLCEKVREKRKNRKKTIVIKDIDRGLEIGERERGESLEERENLLRSIPSTVNTTVACRVSTRTKPTS